MILLQISANTGPEEGCLAVRKALQVLLRECADAGVNVEVLEAVPADKPGNLRSVLLALDGQAAAGVALRWRARVRFPAPAAVAAVAHGLSDALGGPALPAPAHCGAGH